MDELLDPIDQPAKIDYFKIKTLLYWTPVVFIIFIFKIMHWAGTSVVLLVGTAGITAFILSAFIRHRGQHSLNNVFALLALGWFLILISGALFFEGRPYNIKGFTLYFISLLICFGLQEIIKAVRKSNRKKR
jgi:hypothetical protein